ncbi:MAG: hypothetical protein QF654_06515 [Alphaproteobacteria bacterium]|nr:hypothetical protein [Alphaproteobacteria bacterium]
MDWAKIKQIALLALLVGFVGFFGVWRLFHMIAEAYGPVWGGVAALFCGLGLIVIVAVGVIMIRTPRFPPDNETTD